MAIIHVGQRITKVFTLVNPIGILGFPQCENNKHDCNFITPVIADGTDDEFKNDKSSIIGIFETWTTTVTWKLQKESGAIWVDAATITDNTYGEFYPLGYWASKPTYSEIVIYWSNILAAFGTGKYRIEITQTNPTGDVVNYSKPYCLTLYNCEALYNSVRLEWYLNQGIGDIENDNRILDFTGINFYSQIRLPNSIFGYPKSSYDIEETQYQNGEFDDVKNIQTEKYTLNVGHVPAWVHNILKTYACQSDKLLITDYSQNNPQEIVKKAVRLKSAYEPVWNKQSKCAPVTLEFEPRINRLERYRCLPI